MRRWDTLNERQLAVLEQVAAGDDLSGPRGAPLRRSAMALADRGLLAISRRGGVWRAAVTDAGRYYLAHGHHPDNPAFVVEPAEATRRRPRRRSPTTPAGDHGAEAVAKPRHPPATTARLTARRQASATELLAKLADTPQVVVPAPSPEEQAELRRVIDFAKRHGLVPAGKRIEKSMSHNGALRIKLIDGTHPNAKPTVDVLPISVPDEVDVLHPLLSTLSDAAEVLRVSKSSQPRALRIMHALLAEAERRGYEVGWSVDTPPGVEIRIAGHNQSITMEEEQVDQEVMPAPEDLATAKVYSWQRISPEIKTVPSGKLAMSVAGDLRYRTKRWADRKRWSLEDRLGDVLAAVEAQALEKEERRRAEEHAKLQRQRTWEEAMQQARARFWHERRSAALIDQIESWELAARIRAYCGAAEATGRAAAEWMAWARAYADEIDPTVGAVVGPADIEPRPEDLRPYLGRWSAYGPELR